MSWFGSMIGGTVGLILGGPIGAIIGATLGHTFLDGSSGKRRSSGGNAFRERLRQAERAAAGAREGAYDRLNQQQREQQQRQTAYFVALFSILGKVAKADGTITKEEGDAVVRFLDNLNVSGDQRAFAIRVFNEAKNSRYTAVDFARQFAQLTEGRRDLRSSLIDMLFQIAVADGEYHPAEERIIRKVAAELGIGQSETEAIGRRYTGSADASYAVLGLSADASDDEVKNAYRKLVREYHPDTIIAQGMPEEFVQYASQRFQEIQNAWEQIRTKRGL